MEAEAAASSGVTDVATSVLPEWRRVEIWRRDYLEHAGFPPDYADSLSRNPTVDVHVAAELVAGGCPVETAVSILT